MTWKTADKTVPWKFKEKPSAVKALTTIFWDHKGVLLFKYCLKSSTVTSALYFYALIHLQKGIKCERPNLLKRKVILQHDNATLHWAKLIQSLLNQLKWYVFHLLVYSPDLAPSDYHLIPGLKCDLGGWHFTTEERLQSVVTEFFAKQDSEWYSTGIHKLILHYSKCLDEQGDYAKK